MGQGRAISRLLGAVSAANPAGASSPSILSLDSKTETVNGLSSGRRLVDGVGNDLVIITNSTAGQATLRVGANDATSTYAGKIVDHVDAQRRVHRYHSLGQRSGPELLR